MGEFFIFFFFFEQSEEEKEQQEELKLFTLGSPLAPKDVATNPREE